MYNDHCQNLGKHVFGLLPLADKYDIPGLRGKCEQWMAENICASNAVEILLLADLHSCFELANLALNFVALNLVSVKESDDWKVIKDGQRPDIIEKLLKTKLPPNCKKIREDLEELKKLIKKPSAKLRPKMPSTLTTEVGSRYLRKRS